MLLKCCLLYSEGTLENFEKIAEPFLENYCFKCHDSDVSKGDVVLDDLTGVDKYNAAMWHRIWEHTALKQMPPAKKKTTKQPDDLERHKFTEWITSTLEEVMKPHGGYAIHLSASKGNHLNHDLIFGKLQKDLKPASSPARLWRIHPNEHLSRINDLINQPRTENYQTIYNKINKWNAIHHIKFAERHGKHIQGIDGDHKAYLNLDRIVNYASSTIKHSALKGYKSPLMIDAVHGFKDYAHLYSVNEVELNQVRMMAKEILHFMAYGTVGDARQFVDSKEESQKILKTLDKETKSSIHEVPAGFFYKKKPTRPLTPVYELIKEEQVTKSNIEEAIRFLFTSLTFREPKKEDIELYYDIIDKAIHKLGKEQGIISGLSTMFVDQFALFRSELVNYGTPDDYGRVMLQGEELLLSINSALSYIAPDKKLKESLKDGRLKTRADVKRELKRMLDDDQFQKPKILQFFHEYFDYETAYKISKDNSSLAKAGEFVQSSKIAFLFKQGMVETIRNTDLLVEHILKKDKDVLGELLTTNQAFVSARDWKYWNQLNEFERKRECHWHDIFVHGRPRKGGSLTGENGNPIYRYSLVPPSSSFLTMLKLKGEAADDFLDRIEIEPQLVTFPKTVRMGILTHPSWLVSHSDAMDNHAILRGKWITERLLGNAIPEVPITVDAMLPDEPKETLRHRMRITKAKECWSCHQKMDPLGLPFDFYSHAGRHREKEKGKPVDVTGEIINSGIKGLDGKVKTPFELIEKLAKSERAEQVFIRYAFRYWMGRNETINDAKVIQDAYKAYKSNGGSMKALLISLLTSDAFLYRHKTQS